MNQKELWRESKAEAVGLKDTIETDDGHNLDIVNAIIGYEQGDLSQAETIDLFQKLVDSGLAWKLQGHYGRVAEQLIQLGMVRSTAGFDVR